MTSLFELPVDLGPVPAGDLARALHRQIRDAIRDGRLKPGARLPPSRTAPAVFGVSRTTVADLYARLASEGLVTSRRGSGTFVAGPVPRLPSPPIRAAAAEDDPRLNVLWTSEPMSAAVGFWRDGPRSRPPEAAAVDFRPALIDQRLFPFDVLRRSIARQLRRMELKPARLTSPQGNQGSYRLRSAVSDHLGLMRAVSCRPDDVLVTSGAQQAFDIIARALVSPDRRTVAVEDPCYPPLRAAFLAAGARIVPVPVDAEGLVVDELQDEACVVCVCPSHHFPLGMSMSPARRTALVSWARARGAVVVEDDYDGEFRHGGAPIEALRNAGSTDVVFYVGTFSKCMLPSLRLGYVVAPDWAIPTLTAVKNCLDWHCSVPLQLAVAGFIEDGHLARHVTRMRDVYSSRRSVLVAQLERLDGSVEVMPSSYGMHLAVRLRGVDAERVGERLREHAVLVHGLARYHSGPASTNGLVFGIGASDEEAIALGVTALGDVLTR